MAWYLSLVKHSCGDSAYWFLFAVPLNETHADIYLVKHLLIAKPPGNNNYCPCMVLEWFDPIRLETFKVNKLSTGIERNPTHPAADQ